METNPAAQPSYPTALQPSLLTPLACAHLVKQTSDKQQQVWQAHKQQLAVREWTPPRMVCGMVLVERIQSNKHDRATSSKGTSLTLMPHDLHCYLLLATQYTLLSALGLMIKITNQVTSCEFLVKSRMSHLDGWMVE